MRTHQCPLMTAIGIKYEGMRHPSLIFALRRLVFVTNFSNSCTWLKLSGSATAVHQTPVAAEWKLSQWSIFWTVFMIFLADSCLPGNVSHRIQQGSFQQWCSDHHLHFISRCINLSLSILILQFPQISLKCTSHHISHLQSSWQKYCNKKNSP